MTVATRSPAQAQPFVRLSVNISAETASRLKARLARKGITLTEGIRQAIMVWNFFEAERATGNEVSVAGPCGATAKVEFLK